MEIKQIKLTRMATFCYLVGDGSSRTCALIDPAFDTKKLLDEVKRSGFELTHVINTHCHSDHSAGNAAIMAATGAKLLIHELDAERLDRVLNRAFSRVLGGKGSPRPDVLLKDGDVIEIGENTLKVIHTPGHTIGSICLYADGNVFTGDTLFVGSVGRTDLPGGSMKQSGRGTTMVHFLIQQSSMKKRQILLRANCEICLPKIHTLKHRMIDENAVFNRKSLMEAI